MSGYNGKKGNRKKARDPKEQERLLGTFDEFYESNKELLIHRARRFSSIPFEEAIQIGSLGLIRAYEQYDPDKGTKPSTYATMKIDSEIKHDVRDNKPYRNFGKDCMKYKALVNSLGHEPSSEETRERLGWSKEYYQMFLDAMSINDPAPLEYQETNLMDHIGECDNLDLVDGLIDLKGAVEKLTDLEKTVIKLRYFDFMNHETIGRTLEIGPRTSIRVEKSALEKLREAMTEKDGIYPSSHN